MSSDLTSIANKPFARLDAPLIATVELHLMLDEEDNILSHPHKVSIPRNMIGVAEIDDDHILITSALFDMHEVLTIGHAPFMHLMRHQETPLNLDIYRPDAISPTLKDLRFHVTAEAFSTGEKIEKTFKLSDIEDITPPEGLYIEEWTYIKLHNEDTFPDDEDGHTGFCINVPMYDFYDLLRNARTEDFKKIILFGEGEMKIIRHAAATVTTGFNR